MTCFNPIVICCLLDQNPNSDCLPIFLINVRDKSVFGCFTNLFLTVLVSFNFLWLSEDLKCNPISVINEVNISVPCRRVSHSGVYRQINKDLS
jgi:hypothetical protein